MEDLELQGRAVAVAQRALDRLQVAAGPRAVLAHQLQQPRLLALRQQPVEAGADDLGRRVAEHALDRRALVDDDGVGVEHRDQVARVLHQRREARLALAAVHLLREPRALQGQRDLRRQAGQRRAHVLRGLALAGHHDQAAHLAAQRERQHEGVALLVVQQQVGARVGIEADAGAALAAARGSEERERRVRVEVPLRALGRAVRGHDADDLAVHAAQHGRRARVGQRAGGDEGRLVDLLAARRGDERGPGRVEHALAGHGALLLAHQPGDAGDHEQEQRGGRADDDDDVDVAAADLAHELHAGRDQRRPGQQGEAEAAEPDVALRRRVVELAHRRMQRRSAPQQVEADPADVEQHVVVVRPVQQRQAVGRVGDEQGDHARGEQVERRLALAGVDREADGCGQQQDVAERVGDREDLGDRRQLGVVQVRGDQEHPGEQRQAERDDQRVDDARAVRLRVAAADEHEQARHERRVDRDVEAVAQGRERHLLAQEPRVAVGVDVAEEEEREADREPDPRPGRGRPVVAQPDQDRDDRREAERVHHGPGARERRHEDVEGGQGRAEREIHAPEGRSGHRPPRRHVGAHVRPPAAPSARRRCGAARRGPSARRSPRAAGRSPRRCSPR